MRFVATVIAAVLLTAPAAAEPFTFAAMGDLPYNLPKDMMKFDRLIDRINERVPAFSIHVGDIKSGGSPCTDDAFIAVRDRLMQMQGAVFYTPGDNEWTDCHRNKAGGYDPLERLDRLRTLFFSKPKSLGQMPRDYQRQSENGEHAQMKENAIWQQADTLFATVHVVGSNNGLGRTSASDTEFKDRDKANKDWIRIAFKTAIELDAKAVVIALHANPAFENRKARTSKKSGFRRSLKALAKWARTYAHPVLIVHGDRHELIIDQPLRDKDDDLIGNVTRLQVMGEDEVGAVMVTVDPEADTPFTFRSILID